MLHFSYEGFRQLAWYVSELGWWAQGVERRLSANSDAIEAVVAQLAKAKSEIDTRISALEAAAANGEDLSGPLADLRAAAQGLDDEVPDAPVEETPPAV